jgi:membrane protease YdiL (CAAX protease family)
MRITARLRIFRQGSPMVERSCSGGEDIIQQPIFPSITLHLLPGVLTTLVYVITAPFLNSMGYPSDFAFLLTGLFVLVPFELGFLLYLGRKKNGTLSLDGIVLYRESMPIKQYVLFAVALLVYANFILAVVYPPIARILTRNLFFWLPSWFFLSLTTEYSKSVLLMTALLGLAVNGFIGPITEELYFRGYLLPRISRFGVLAPVINGVLHSLYHFWMPWQVPGWILALLPAAFVVWWKRSLYLSMIIHVTGNVLGSIVTLASILSLP